MILPNCNSKIATTNATSEPTPRGPSSRRRRLETLQRYRTAWLQPYLDFANLLEAASELPKPEELPNYGFGEPVTKELADKVSKRFPVPGEVRSGIKGANKGRIVGWLPDGAAPDHGYKMDILSLYETFYAVREIARRVAQFKLPGSSRPIPVGPMYRFLTLRDDGTIQFSGSLLDGFLRLLEQVDPTRIRLCPICDKVFYATRANKGACDEHLAYARVQRGRNPEMRKRYEENRKINRLVREGKSRTGERKRRKKHRKKRTYK